MPSVLIPLAQGCEEMEAVIIIDILRRAGVTVITAGLDKNIVKASRGVMLTPDALLDDLMEQDFDMIVLPGGMPGADHLDHDPRIRKLIQGMKEKGKYIAAICAAPKVLANAGVLANTLATSYPGVLEKINSPSIKVLDLPVVKDGAVITSRGPGTAMDFALELVETLTDEDTRNKVEAALVRSTPGRYSQEDNKVDITKSVHRALIGEAPPSLRFIYAHLDKDALYFHAVFTDEAIDEHLDCASNVLTEVMSDCPANITVHEKIEKSSSLPWKGGKGELLFLRYGELRDA